MYIEQLYTRHLSASAYYIESGEDAAIIDPMRDVQQYLNLAAKRNTRIRYVFATHFQSDYISGCVELAAKTGAKLIYGPGAVTGFQMHVADDGDEFRLGFLSIKVLHTPGHTPESTCYLLLDDSNNSHSVFTGDTLFVDDVGRTDLFSETKSESERLAGIMYDSIFQKLLSLPNYTVVYPGHGAGSVCGKVIGRESHTTIGIQRNTNYALKAQNKNEFIRLVTENRPNDPPDYFVHMMQLNRSGALPMDKILEQNLKPLSYLSFMELMQKPEVSIIDTRSMEDFSAGHIPGSVFLGPEGNFEFSAGLVLEQNSKLLLVCEPGCEKEMFTRLARTGFDNAYGYLDGGLVSWTDSGGITESLENISAEEVAGRFRYNTDIIIDVRNPNEWIPGIIAGAKLISLQHLKENISGLDRKKNIYVYCSCGYRSMIASSILKRKGFLRVTNVTGGMQQMKQTPIPVRQLSRIG